MTTCRCLLGRVGNSEGLAGRTGQAGDGREGPSRIAGCHSMTDFTTELATPRTDKADPISGVQTRTFRYRTRRHHCGHPDRLASPKAFDPLRFAAIGGCSLKSRPRFRGYGFESHLGHLTLLQTVTFSRNLVHNSPLCAELGRPPGFPIPEKSRPESRLRCKLAHIATLKRRTQRHHRRHPGHFSAPLAAPFLGTEGAAAREKNGVNR